MTLTSVLSNVIKPQGVEPFQFSTKISSPSDGAARAQGAPRQPPDVVQQAKRRLRSTTTSARRRPQGASVISLERIAGPFLAFVSE